MAKPGQPVLAGCGTSSSPAVLGRAGQVANSLCRPAGTAEHSAAVVPDRGHRDLRSSDPRPQRPSREIHWFTAAACQRGQPVITKPHGQAGAASACRLRDEQQSSGSWPRRQVANSQCRPAGGGERWAPAVPDHGHRDLRSSGSRPQRSIREIQWFTAAACQLGQPVITEAPRTKT